MPPSRSSLLVRLTAVSPQEAQHLERALVVHATLCLARRAPAPARPSGTWRPWLQPSELPSGWDVVPWFCDTATMEPGECVEAAVIGVPAEPVPMAWLDGGKTFRLHDGGPGGPEVGKGVVLGVHWPRSS